MKNSKKIIAVFIIVTGIFLLALVGGVFNSLINIVSFNKPNENLECRKLFKKQNSIKYWPSFTNANSKSLLISHYTINNKYHAFVFPIISNKDLIELVDISYHEPKPIILISELMNHDYKLSQSTSIPESVDKIFVNCDSLQTQYYKRSDSSIHLINSSKRLSIAANSIEKTNIFIQKVTDNADSNCGISFIKMNNTIYGIALIADNSGNNTITLEIIKSIYSRY